MQISEQTKKIFGIVSKVLAWIVVAFTVCVMVFTVVTVKTVDKNDRSLFGTKLYIVQSDSMSLSDKNADLDVHFNAGDLILVKTADDPTALQAGEVISFISTNSQSYGETITHRIREVKTDAEGKTLGYVTYGTNTGVDDEALVEPEYVLGVYAGKIKGAGSFFAFLKTPKGYVVCILLPFLLLIGYNAWNCVRLYRKYKREQAEELQAERAQIEEERRQNAEMLKELQALKAQLHQERNDEEQSE